MPAVATTPPKQEVSAKMAVASPVWGSGLPGLEGLEGLDEPQFRDSP